MVVMTLTYYGDHIVERKLHKTFNHNLADLITTKHL